MEFSNFVTFVTTLVTGTISTSLPFSENGILEKEEEGNNFSFPGIVVFSTILAKLVQNDV